MLFILRPATTRNFLHHLVFPVEPPVFAAKDPQRAQLGYAAASAGLGIAWIIISFFALSNEALPMLLVSLPFAQIASSTSISSISGLFSAKVRQ